MDNHPTPPEQPASQDNVTAPVKKKSRLKRWLVRLSALLTISATAHTIGAWTSVHAIMETRTAQGAVAWAVSLNTFPYLAVPLYWVFGRSEFQGYTTARHRVDEELLALEPEVEAAGDSFLVTPKDPRGSHRVLTRMTELPMTTGNDVELLIDGDQTFESIFTGMDAAKEYILVQFFIVKNDGLGQRLRDKMIERARAGIDVYFLYDEIGCHSLPRSYLNALREAGVEVSAFGTTQGRGNRFQLNFRNHRKIVVTDGTTAWVGGHNVGDQYLGLSPKFGHWRDTHVRIVGPSVLAVQLAFLEDWYWATRSFVELDWLAALTRQGDKVVHIIPSSPADPQETTGLLFLEAITTARDRIWIASPYFVPDEGIIAALKLADLRGVEVKILIPDDPDHKLVYLTAFTFLRDLKGTDIKIFRYQKGFLHQKVMLVDHDAAVVGTANLDNRSFRLNFEISALVVDAPFAAKVEAMLKEDFAHSRLMTPTELDDKPFWFRFAARAARLTAPVQ
ncbi:cardiolipin synthase [Desulfoluna butyratoxydans]|uniref:Cardiolipin synthase n=1 Tax=Desulfoluna butyratoxydans TaxID=231438 RepID=A0A4U8YNK2_9BACT|nr:cardiolipin synthase [Desulfoluna butyratoxydans]VFQ45686.1 cardiolipin synthase [Desulfoluna butyratoxydans]